MKFSESDKKALSKNFAELRVEMSIDTKQLSEHNQIKTLLATKAMLEKKLEQIQDENRNLEHNLRDEQKSMDKIRIDIENIKDEIGRLDALEAKAFDEK